MPNKKKTSRAPAKPPGAPAKSVYDRYIDEAAAEHGIDRWLLRSIIWNESSDDPNARSQVGARGLAQIMPATFNYIRTGLGYKDVKNIDDPRDNVRAGAKYLRYLMDKFKNPTMAVAAYNAGPGNVNRHIRKGTAINGVPDIKETRDYVGKVMGDYNRFATEMQKTTQQQQDLAQPNAMKIPSLMEMFGPKTQGPLLNTIPAATPPPQQQSPVSDLSQIPGVGFAKKLLGWD